MLCIGFANKYFTLWDVTEHVEDNVHYKTVWTSHSFIKNISMDKKTAFSKHPGVPFDETLRGHYASFNSEKKKVWDNVDTFRFGKYEGKLIAENSDTEYLEWYYTSGCYDDEHREFVKNELKRRGYVFETYTYEDTFNHQMCTRERMLSPEQAAERAVENANKEEIKKILINKENLELIMERNLDDEGDYIINNYLLYHFNDYVIREYNGYPYGMPSINGKGKRVKGKLITITEYTWKEENGKILINIIKFEINK